MEMLQFTNADYGIAGQGEESFPQLISMIDSREVSTDIPGLVYRSDQTIRMNPPLIKGYDNINADWSIMDIKPYSKKFNTPPAAVIVKTGCPYECSYCEKITMCNKSIPRDIDQIIEDIKIIKKIHKVRTFFLIDPCFNAPLDFAKELLYKIIKAKLKIRFSTPLVPVHHSFDDEFFDLFHKAGGYFTMVGVDSFSEQMLINYRKPFNLEDIDKFGRLANKHYVKFGVEQIFGGPGETNETVRESLSFLSKIDYSLHAYTIGIRILPETALFKTAIKEGLFKDSSELFFSKFYVSKNIDLELTQKYIDQETKKYAYRYRRMATIGIRNILARI
jgi:radical SAM superfamily enzyme YgiQ (UPF0313 family)